MDWLATLQAIDDFEDLEFNTTLVRRLEAGAGRARPLRFSTPTFKHYDSSDVAGCGKNSFPAFSVTGGACALDCEHCHARILEPMRPAFTPAELDRDVRALIERQDLNGFLLSGGSNRRNEIRYERFYPVLSRLKNDYPHLRIAVHSALTDTARSQAMADAGVDTAMLDIIGAQETVRDVYHLDRPVADFERSLEALCATGMEVVPHIVIGLHYGKVLGEYTALDMIARHPIHALVLVVLMPFYATPGKFATPDADAVGEFFLAARKRISERELLLGCARPAGGHKRLTDAYAVMAGLDGIAFPADGVAPLARALGREIRQEHACCSLKLAQPGAGIRAA